MSKDEKKPPSNLSKEAKVVWYKILDGWELDESGLLILKTALESYDRLQACRVILDREGCRILQNTGSGQKMMKHPLCDVEREARSGFLAAMKQLGLQSEAEGEGDKKYVSWRESR